MGSKEGLAQGFFPGQTCVQGPAGAHGHSGSWALLGPALGLTNGGVTSRPLFPGVRERLALTTGAGPLVPSLPFCVCVCLSRQAWV